MQGGISQDENDNEVSSRLTNELLKTEKGKDAPPFLCQGQSPWLGDDIHGDCAQAMRGILINATNVHYGNIKSAIRLPFDLGDRVLEEIRETLGDPRYRSVVRTLDSIGDSTAEIVAEKKNGG
ncbi:MAG TPA: hypothetical protein EYN66_23720 [Myxococcales bacterium]|nr:hypothetical protein [Myxococcales bacterium]